VSFTLQSDTEGQTALPSRRSALREESALAADFTRVTDPTAEPVAAVIAAGWYADPMGSEQARWWDGSAWTAELSTEARAESGAVAGLAALAACTDAAAPLSRRQLRERIGPLTSASILIDAPAPTSPEPTPVESGARSPFEALFESSLAERASAESPVVSAAPFFDPTALHGPVVTRPWIGASAPLVPAASAPMPVAVQQAPTGPPPAFVAPPLPDFAPPRFTGGALGFSLPPDPFAASSSAIEARPTPFVALAPVAMVTPRMPAISAGSTTTVVWLFALLPVVHAAALWLALGLLDLGGNPVIRYSVVGAPLFLSLLLAFIDGRVLRDRGFLRTASAVFALVPPVYLLVRAVRVGAAGVVPLLIWLLLQIAAFSFIVLQLPAVFTFVPFPTSAPAAPVVVASGPITKSQRAIQLTPTGMAAELTRQALAKKLTFSSISCPPIPATTDGTAVSCVGTLASVRMTLNVVIDSTLPNSAFALMSEAPAG
jgi:hypothetical protein